MCTSCIACLAKVPLSTRRATSQMKKTLTCIALAVAASTIPPSANAADVQRQADIAERGKDVMPFNLKATTHIFTKTVEGGTQRVIAKHAGDKAQTKLIREHLQEIRRQFLEGDFSGPSYIHGNDMPGLAELRSAKPGKIAIEYREVADGAELHYRTSDAKLVAALHNWFDAQLADHGPDAIEGQRHHHGDMPKP